MIDLNLTAKKAWVSADFDNNFEQQITVLIKGIELKDAEEVMRQIYDVIGIDRFKKIVDDISE